MPGSFSFRLNRTDGAARLGAFETQHGMVHTPTFMPVGTSGAVKALTAHDLEECGAEIMLGNTYHLYLRPGEKLIRKMGGLAEFTGWKKSTLTDSGGFQVFSMQDLLTIDDEGVTFRSHHDGSRHRFFPEKVIEIERDLGADIIMSFDQCAPYPADRELASAAARRTFDWARKGLEHFRKLEAVEATGAALFGIVQGSVYPDLRRLSAEQIISLDFSGYAIGGLAVGESKEEMEDTLGHTIELLPQDKPRYMMGVGYPEDLLMAASYGVDMFDCVLPTRNARTGMVFTSEGPLVFRNADCARDDRPLDPNCGCKVCRRYSRAYIRHLYNQREITALVLATYHSTYFFQKLLLGIRESIKDGCFGEFRREFLDLYLQGNYITDRYPDGR
ncbi:MAG: tRNA guanosine(34) transglycosylase Tgt [Candidatus Zixiibacteriota bacterium]|nr:MAG: tRNA guanosine(34) transglycosylase Tgt [candidate division Zixibacteria bacterium]